MITARALIIPFCVCLCVLSAALCCHCPRQGRQISVTLRSADPSRHQIDLCLSISIRIATLFSDFQAARIDGAEKKGTGLSVLRWVNNPFTTGFPLYAREIIRALRFLIVARDKLPQGFGQRALELSSLNSNDTLKILLSF